MFSEIGKAYKHLDVLINNAGQAVMNYAVLTPLKTVKDIMETNFIGAFLCCREAIKLMQKSRSGRIVNLSSISVPMGPAGTSIYSASKAAVEQFSKVLAKEVAAFGITVNTLCLSLVKDGGMAGQIDDKAIRQLVDQGGLSKSWLSLEDITHAIDALISKEKIETGQVLNVGGP